MTQNPYQPPSAGVSDPQLDAGGDGGFLGAPRKREAGAGINWISDAWKLFTANPGMWIVFLILLFGISLVVQFIPLIGGLAQGLLMPILVGGIMMGCDSLRRGGSLEFDHLFAAFKTHAGPLLVVGAIYVVASVVIMIIALAPFLGMVGLSIMTGGGAEQIDPAQLGGFFIGILVAMLLLVPVMAAYWFAVPLVALNNVPPLEAMKLSFFGCLKNWLAFLIYGLVAMVIAFAASLPLMLGWLVAGPLFMATIYTGYRDIYYEA
ncbi:MAG: hypothetical protein KDI56_14350 [Xanthomonadales bacterium]|nr:hypothetical protein [Xanthomonadales bacterium]MCB1626544.1 hypothetical protein [Xanthomonadales bacterium]